MLSTSELYGASPRPSDPLSIGAQRGSALNLNGAEPPVPRYMLVIALRSRHISPHIVQSAVLRLHVVCHVGGSGPHIGENLGN